MVVDPRGPKQVFVSMLHAAAYSLMDDILRI